MLQLVFLVLSIGIVTLFPAAFALQRVLPDAISQDQPSLLRRFFTAVRLGLQAASGWPASGCTSAASRSRSAWCSGRPPTARLRIFALAVLIPLTGMIVGLYLSALAVLPDKPVTRRPRRVCSGRRTCSCSAGRSRWRAG